METPYTWLQWVTTVSDQQAVKHGATWKMPATRQLLIYYEVIFGSLLGLDFNHVSDLSDDAPCDVI